MNKKSLENLLDETISLQVYDIPIFGLPVKVKPLSRNSNNGRVIKSKSPTYSPSLSPSLSPSPSVPSSSRISSPTTCFPRYYCQACRKTFSSKQTLETHLKGPKHALKPTHRKNVENKGISVGERKDVHAMESLKKAQRISNQKPDVAITVMWNIAQALSNESSSKDIFEALYTLRNVLNVSPDLSNCENPISAREKLELKYQTNFGLGRLFARYNECETALAFYSYALAIPFPRISLKEIIHLAKNVQLLSRSLMLDRARMLIQGQQEFGSKISPDKLLEELTSLFMSRMAEYEIQGVNFTPQIAIVLLTLICVCGRVEVQMNWYTDTAEKYKEIDMDWAAFDCHMEAAFHEESEEVEIPLLRAGILLLGLDDNLRAREWMSLYNQHIHLDYLDLKIVHKRLQSRMVSGLIVGSGSNDAEMIESLLDMNKEVMESQDPVGLVLHKMPITERGQAWLDLELALKTL